MTLKACPLCGYRFNAPENQTCGKCKGWLGGPSAAAGPVAAEPASRSLAPRNLRELACYLAVPLGALLYWPNPIGAAFGLVMGAFMIKTLRLDMERFSKGVLLGIVAVGVFFSYLIFLLVFSFVYGTVASLLQPLTDRVFKH